jgi:hypothetical protein
VSRHPVSVERLREVLREEGGLLAAPATEDPPDAAPVASADASGPPGPARVAASGPRAEAHRDAVELAVQAIHEGYLLHYGRPRALTIDDPDLALLAGDRLYALGLARLASLGDLPAIAELADVISLAAQAHAEDAGDRAEAAWELGAACVGWGATPESVGAKARARAGADGAAGALREAATPLSGAEPV